MKNVYGYIRVSTLRQGEGVSLIAQKEAITRYAEQYNLNIIKWFEEKETAAKQGRTLFTEMMKLLKAKKADGVIIHKIDRSARNITDWANIDRLIEDGADVHFAHESLDLHTRGGRLAADIQAAIAVDFIRNNRQEVKKGLEGRLKQGLYPFAAPLGYLNTGRGKPKVIDPLRGPLIKKAFEFYATNKFNLKTLVVELNKLGLTNQNGSYIKVSNISNVLNNPFYIGIMRSGESLYNGLHTPLISTSLFKEVQAVLRGNTNQKAIKHHYRYKKILRCKSCGYSMVAERQKGYVYYRCHTKKCSTTGIREQAIDTTILRYFTACELLPNEHIELKELLDEISHEWGHAQRELHQSINIQIANLKQKLDRLTDVYLENNIDKDTFERKKQTFLFDLKFKEEQEKNILSAKGATLRKVEKFLELAKSLINSYLTGDLQEQRELLEITTSNLWIEGKKLIISMCSPFLELVNLSNVHWGAHYQDALRKTEGENVIFPEYDLPPREPLTKEQLRSLLRAIIEAVSQLPEDHFESNHDL